MGPRNEVSKYFEACRDSEAAKMYLKICILVTCIHIIIIIILLYNVQHWRSDSNMCCSLWIILTYQTGTEDLRTLLDLVNNKVQQIRKERKKSLQGLNCNYRRAGFSSFNLKYLLLFCFTVSSTEGLTATCAAAFELPNWNWRPQNIWPSNVTEKGQRKDKV